MREESIELANIVVEYIDPNTLEEIVLEAEDLEKLVLENIAIEFGGLTDPIGQLMSWLSQQLTGLGNWIISSVEGVFESVLAGLAGISVGELYSYFRSIFSTILSIPNAITSLGESISNLFTDMLNNISNLLNNLANTITQSFQQFVVEPITDIVNQAVNLVTNLINTVQTAVTETIPNAISSLISNLQSQITNIINSLSSALQNVVNLVGQIDSTIQKFLTEDLPNSINQSVSQIQGIVKGVVQAISNIPATIQDVLSQIGEGVQKFLTEEIPKVFENASNVLKSIVETITSEVTKIPELFKELVSKIQEQVKGISSAIEQAFLWIKDLEHVPEWFAKLVENIVTPIKNVLNQLGTAYTGFMNSINNIWNWLVSEFKKIGEWIWSALPPFVKDAITWLQKSAQWFIENFPKTLGDVVGMLQKLGEQIWNALPPFVKDALTWLQKGFQWVVENFNKGLLDIVGGWNWLKEEFGKRWNDFVQFITMSFPQFLDWLKERFGGFSDWASKGWKWMVEEFSKGWDLFKEILEEPSKLIEKVKEWFDQNVTPIVSDLADRTFKSLQDVGKRVWDWISGGLSWLSQQVLGFLSGLGQTIANTVAGIGVTLWNAGKGLGESLGNMINAGITGLLKPLFETIGKALHDQLKSTLEKIVKGEETEETVELMLLMATPFLASLSARYIWLGLMWLGELLDRVRISPRVRISIRPLGVGGSGETTVHLDVNMGRILKHIGAMIKEAPDELFRAMTVGFGIWFTRPLMRPLTALYRNIVVMELPSLGDMRRIIRRHMPTDIFEDVYGKARRFLELYGYSDDVIDWFMKRAEEDYIELTDRFGAKRKWPLSLLFDFPSRSDLVRMMIHDIFASYEDFEKAMQSAGFYTDVAHFYYLLHFRYPTPDQLWNFYSRAQAGLVWYPGAKLSEDEEKMIRERGLGFMPLPPTEVAKNPKNILDAINIYMKWHDYFYGSWIRGFTSDRWILIDLMADIPTRIDARWMYKWGVWTGAEPKTFQSDSLELSRIVVARGIHPKYVHLVSLGEVLNSVAEERTLLRSSVLNAFRDGVVDVKTLVNVLGGAVKVDLAVLKWDEREGKFKPSVYTVPIKYTVPEIKILSARALYERGRDLITDHLKELARASRENFISVEFIEEAIKKFTEEINKILAEEAKALGIEGAVVMTIDEAWLKAYLATIEIEKQIYTRRRVRSWIQYLLRNILYRIERGYVTSEEVKSIIEGISKTASLTNEEKEILKKIVELIESFHIRQVQAEAIIAKFARGEIKYKEALDALVKLGMSEEVAKAELERKVKTYIPSVSQVATLAELVPEAFQILDEVMELRGVPKHHREIWRKYVALKTVKDEVSRFVTEIIMDYAKGVISKDQFEKFLKELKKFGYTDVELELLRRLAELRRARYAR